MNSVSSIAVLCDTLKRHFPRLSLELFQVLLDVIEGALALTHDRSLEIELVRRFLLHLEEAEKV